MVWYGHRDCRRMLYGAASTIIKKQKPKTPMKTIKATFITLTIAVALMMNLNVFAQQEKGDTQMQLNLQYFGTSGGGTGTFTGVYNFSFFANKHVEYGASYILSLSSGSTTNTISPFLNFNILSKSGKFVFYFGALYDFNSYTTTSTDIYGNPTTTTTNPNGPGGKIGIRVYVTESIFYNLEQRVSSLNDGTNSSTSYITTAGIGILLKKKHKG
jgi:hypothetical protein